MLSGKSPTGTRWPPGGDRDADQGQGRAVQPAIAPPDQVGEGHAAANHHADQQDLAKDVDVVFAAQVRRREVFGKVEGQHRQEAMPPSDRAMTPVILPRPVSSRPVW